MLRIPKIQVSCLGNRDRWGNQLFQYYFARQYAEKHGAILEIPSDWIGNQIFFMRHFSIRNKLPICFFPSNEIDIDIFNGFIRPELVDKQKANEWFEFRPEILERYSVVKGEYVAAHLRRGDFADLLHRLCIIEESSYIEAMLKEGIDPKKVVWVSEESGNHWLQDFITLMSAKTLFIANSTFSYWAALLGNNTVYSPRSQGKTGYAKVKFVKGLEWVQKWA